MEKTYKGKSMKPGGGGRFAKGKDALMAQGKSEESAGAIMAAQGRKKYGKAAFQKMAAAGRKSTKGSPPFTAEELAQGHRKIPHSDETSEVDIAGQPKTKGFSHG